MNTRSRLVALVLLSVSLGLTGCVYRSYQEGGAHYTSWSFGTSQGVSPFSLEAGKRDDPSYRKLESKGLTNDPSATAIEAASAGAVRGAMSFAKP